jgi:DNA polymerase-1
MIKVRNGFLVEDVSELPQLQGRDLYEDLETTSGDPKKKSLSPWRDCKVCGVAVASDNSPTYYIPVHHNGLYSKYNLPREAVVNWQKDTLKNHKRWVNQNVKYDAHVVYNDFGLDFDGDYVCTINSRAKLNDSERQFKGGYSLDVLASQDLGRDISNFEDSLNPYRDHSHDYGDIPPDILGGYACEDVNTVRDLEAHYPHEPVEQLEIDVTKALISMERAGIHTIPMNITVEKVKAIIEMNDIEQEIFQKTGKFINPSSQNELEDAILNIFGLPIIAWTDDDENSANYRASPSFNKKALKEYKDLVDSPVWFLDLVIRYRSLKTYLGLFLEAYAEKNIDGVLHCWYNQTIRTGRMSCSNPNLTQCDGRAKLLIVPKPGCSIARYDYSQIEFRIIAHYIKFIQPYLDNPDLDFYTGMAERANCTRDPSKVICLGSAYGMGKPKCAKSLSALAEVKNYVRERLQENPNYMRLDDERKKQVLIMELEKHGGLMYDTFHRQVPTLKKTFYEASNTCKARGYVKTMMGRKRHLGSEWSNKAFNAACQGSAADLIKYKIVELHKLLKGSCIDLLLQVHDELVFEGPTEIIEDPRFSRDILAIMEENPLPMQIPLRAAGGHSRKNWKDACWKKKKDCKRPEDKEEIVNPYGTQGERLRWLGI